MLKIQILTSVEFEPTTSCIRGNRLTARPQRMQEVVDSNPTEGKNYCFNNLLYFIYRVECENCFVKLKSIKINKNINTLVHKSNSRSSGGFTFEKV